MDIVPLWLQMTSAMVGDVGSLAALVACLWPVFIGKETLRELLHRRALGRQAAPPVPPGGQPVPQPKNPRRALFNILALVVPLLILMGSSVLLGARLFAGGGYIQSIDFENGIKGWSTSDRNTQLSVTTTPVYSGKQALEVNTQLSAPASIEVAVYFNQMKPAGSDLFGPYNFAGKHISCFLYLPDALAKEVFVQIFMKDTNSVLHHFAGTEYSQPYSIDSSRTGKWVEISYQVGTGTPDPKGFNPAEVDAMGIRIETNTGSHLTFTGSFYIDDCTIKS